MHWRAMISSIGAARPTLGHMRSWLINTFNSMADTKATFVEAERVVWCPA
jgi:hypothetical protein